MEKHSDSKYTRLEIKFFKKVYVASVSSGDTVEIARRKAVEAIRHLRSVDMSDKVKTLSKEEISEIKSRGSRSDIKSDIDIIRESDNKLKDKL